MIIGNPILNLATGGGWRFVCGGNTSNVYFSEDGETWTIGGDASASSTHYMSELMYCGNNQIIGISRYSSAGIFFYSTDGGDTWTKTSRSSCSFRSLAYNPDARYSKIACNGYDNYMYIKSGVADSWTRVTKVAPIRYNYSMSFKFCNDKWILGPYSSNTNLYYSTLDPVLQSWTAGTIAVETSLTIRFTYYHDTPDGGVYLCGGNSGTLYRSTDGISWTQINLGETSYLMGATYGLDRFVIVGDGFSYYSADGLTWTEMTGAGSEFLNSVAFGEGRFVATGDNGYSCYSTDGATWLPMTGLPSNGSYNAVTFCQLV